MTFHVPGHDKLSLTFNVTDFDGDTIMSATSEGVSTDQYRRMAMLFKAMDSGGASTASAVDYSATFTMQGSNDGVTWVDLAEVNGHAITPATIYPNTTLAGLTEPAARKAYVYPVWAKQARVKISNAGLLLAPPISCSATMVLEP